MTSQDIKVTNSLTYAGVVPFIIAITLLVLKDADFSGFLSYELGLIVFLSYSILIASFMAGTLWGRLQGNVLQSDFADVRDYSQILCVSNLLCLAAWFSGIVGLLGYYASAVLLLLSVYILIYVYERRCWKYQASSSSDRYTKLRLRVTSAVVVLHMVAFMLLV